MKEEEMINLLRHYRHDWLNDVQLLIGYTSMGKMDKVQAKLKESVEQANKERKLENLLIPKTSIWLISFNWKHDNYRIDYQVELNNKDLSNHDDFLYNQLTSIMKNINFHTDKMEFYRGKIVFSEDYNNQTVVKLCFTGKFINTESLKNDMVETVKLHKVKVEPDTKDKYTCTLSFICN